MSIRTLNIEKYTQVFTAEKNNKATYGEVHTDFTLIHKILDLVPTYLFADPTKKWLDPCCGRGYFTMVLYKRLFHALSQSIPDTEKRHKHIIEHMIYMIEINSEHIPRLYELFGENANILNGDFLEVTNQKYDIVIGNPPFNINGAIKVPTRNNCSKKTDGKMIWAAFVKKAVDSLRPFGYLVFIIPSIWMKKDHSMYSFITQYRISKLHTLSNTATNKIFHGQAQTPTCYFTLSKYTEDPSITIYDKDTKEYITFAQYHETYPLCAASIFKKLAPFIKKAGSITVKKTNMPRKHTLFSLQPHKNFPHKNIKTCILNGSSPNLVINYSNQECAFARVPKLVLAHKMYGFPFYDKHGEYGISNRDNYVIYDRTSTELERLMDFLSTKFALYLFEGTRYRMKYLEKYVFDLIPDITQLKDFPQQINDTTIADYFKLSTEERLIIADFHKKEYSFFSKN
jgi:hypothetical protein